MTGSRIILLFEQMKAQNIVKTRKDFCEMLGIDYKSLAKYIDGRIGFSVNSENFDKFRDAGVNINWLLTGKGEPFLKAEITPSKPPVLCELENLIDQHVSSKIDEQKILLDGHKELLEELESRQQAMQDELSRLMQLYSSKDTGVPPSPSEYRIQGGTECETHQSAPSYGSDDEDEPTERLPLALNLAAGIPREACDSGDTVAVPSRFLKKGHNYCVAKIAGTSMTEAGIQDGSHVLLEYSNEPKAGAIMVVKYGANTTLKLLHLTEGGTWELRYQDGSGAKVELKDYTWEVQGLFVRVLKP